MNNRIKQFQYPGKIPSNGDNLKQDYDRRKNEMRAKTVQESTAKLHKRMMEEIQEMVPEWRKTLCTWIWPRWLNNAIAISCQCLPPNALITWAVSPGIHMAYKWTLLLPLVIPNSLIRLLIVIPLQFIRSRVYLYGIKRNIRQLDDYNCELTITSKDETRRFVQDWRYGEVKRIRENLA